VAVIVIVVVVSVAAVMAGLACVRMVIMRWCRVAHMALLAGPVRVAHRKLAWA